MGKVSETVSKLKVWGLAGAKDFVARKIRWWSLSRRLARIARRDAGGAPERGITLIGDFTSGGSNSKTNRDFAFALKDAGIPFQTFSTGSLRSFPEGDVAGMLTPPGDFRLRRYTHVVEMFRSPLPRGAVPLRARIAFWEGEHGILDVWPFLGGGDPVIAMSDFNAEYFRKELQAPVSKIVYPLRKMDFPAASPFEMRRRFGIGEKDFMVFFNFDFGSFARKNPVAAIRAFAKAFPREKDARLVFKTMGAKSHPACLERLRREADAAGIGGRFSVVAEYLPQAELYGLAGACDVYISLHRGEGFGLGMAEAMQMGKPVVATGWSANMEFTRPGVSFPVPYRLVPVADGEYFTCMREWADADADAAAAALRRLYDDRAFAADTGAKGKAFVEEHFSTANFRKSVEAFLDGKQ